ncbi:MAG: type I-B CRISPR-associated protein Cas7/Cst2/DevR [Chloroflexi bacterium]|nr:type I-B CRISPR-associated protein Cas7/Cst2/DevR [Chloroflexota bacterium]
MAYLSGIILVDAPASALNNSGGDPEASTDNAVATKVIKTRHGAYPYVSAQAFRYWLRTTLASAAAAGELPWINSPIFREQKVAYTDGNPIEYWEDDLFGYMRAPSRRTEAAAARQADQSRVGRETPTTGEITRVSPFRVSPLIAIAPVTLTRDFGTMSRHEGDPVPHEHQFYRAVLKGLISLNLHAVGTFSEVQRSGYRNLDDNRVKQAVDAGLEYIAQEKSYRLKIDDRIERVAALLKGLALVSGGAKQALHYTDVSPVVILAGVFKGGNDPLQYVVGAGPDGQLRIHTDALKEMVRAWGDQMISPLYAGWVQGFYDDQRSALEKALQEIAQDSDLRQPPLEYRLDHPRAILSQLTEDLGGEQSSAWMA